MMVFWQIFLGSSIMLAGMFMQIAAIGWIVRRLRSSRAFVAAATVRKIFWISWIVFIPLLMSHTAHIYAWALALWLLGALPGYEEPIYFSLVTYTTVGYGDVTLPSDFRIFGAMASVNGILSFGLTTAFLVGLFSKIITSLREE
jgi:voltage-gated potassium channel Kch